MLSTTIISHLLHDNDYCRKVFPYLKEEYFDDQAEKKIFDSMAGYIDEYREPPTPQALKILLSNRSDCSEEDYKEIKKLIMEMEYDPNTNKEWLTKETEKYCQERAFFNALKKCVNLQDTDNKAKAPEIMAEALGVSFDNHIGHDYFNDMDDRFDFYHKKEERIPFDIDLLNVITKGGLPKKSLTCFLAGTGVGKTLVMTHFASEMLKRGKNVLYITLEMAEERITERIDANLLDVALDDLIKLDVNSFRRRINHIRKTTTSELIVKEYPTGSANVNHFRHLLNELKLKKRFIPDIIFVDYINLCSSSRVKAGGSANSYTIIKSIAEELRGLAMEFNLPIVSATQTTRSGNGASDIDLVDTSESIGLPQTLDCYIGIIKTEELEATGRIMFKQLKNRWGSLDVFNKFLVGIDRTKMRLFNLEDTAQKDIIDMVSFDKGGGGNNFNKPGQNGKRNKFVTFDDEDYEIPKPVTKDYIDNDGLFE